MELWSSPKNTDTLNHLELYLLQIEGFYHMYKSGLIYFAFQINIRNCYNRNSKQIQIT